MTVQNGIATAYDVAQFDDNFPAGVEDHFWFAARNIVVDRTLRHAVRRGWIPARPKILEVGCGTGIVVDALGRRGHDIRGVELGRPPRTLSPDRTTHGCRAQDLSPDVRAGVDVLLFLDVLEHVPDDVALLRETIAAFPRCRAVVVTVPARPELWSDHDRHYGHYRRYDRTLLTETFNAAGLKAASTRYMFRSLYLAARLMLWIGRQRNPVMAAPKHKVLHSLAGAVLVAEDVALNTAPLPGLSVIGVGLRTLP